MVEVNKRLRYVCVSFVIFLWQSTFACEIVSKWAGITCPSLDAAIVASITQRDNNLKVLHIVNDGKSELIQMKNGTFSNYPQINDLRITNVINGMERGAFNGLSNLYELHFDNNKMHVIPPQIFQNLPIVFLYVFNCEVQEISPKAFDKLPNLRTVYIYGNTISTIIEGVFTGTKIKKLILLKNGIRTIEPNAFSGMPNLNFLSLSENELTSFNPQLAIGVAPKLELLYIDNNKIDTFTREMYITSTNLRKLLLNQNRIQKLDNQAFYDLVNLQYLDISNNIIEELNTNVFNPAKYKYLELLFLHNNKMTFLENDVFKFFPNLKSISMGGNPWQCSCWKLMDEYLRKQNITKICYEEYSQGNRPFCVTSENESKNCIYNIDKVNDFIELYNEAIQDYATLPLVCNINNNGKPSLDSYYSYNIF